MREQMRRNGDGRLWTRILAAGPETVFAILTLGVNVLMYLSEHYIVPQAGTSAYLHPVSVILGFLPSSARLGDFANGIVSLSDIVYFVAFIALMLFLTDRAMEKRRHAKG